MEADAAAQRVTDVGSLAATLGEPVSRGGEVASGARRAAMARQVRGEDLMGVVEPAGDVRPDPGRLRETMDEHDAWPGTRSLDMQRSGMGVVSGLAGTAQLGRGASHRSSGGAACCRVRLHG